MRLGLGIKLMRVLNTKRLRKSNVLRTMMSKGQIPQTQAPQLLLI